MQAPFGAVGSQIAQSDFLALQPDVENAALDLARQRHAPHRRWWVPEVPNRAKALQLVVQARQVRAVRVALTQNPFEGLGAGRLRSGGGSMAEEKGGGGGVRGVC